MDKTKKKRLIILGIIIALFIITNPSNSNFEYYLQAKGIGKESVMKYPYEEIYGDRGGIESIGSENVQAGRLSYFLIYSIYQAGHTKYLGILGNFIKITGDNKKIKKKVSIEELKQDSIKKAQQEADSLNQIKMQKEQERIQDSIKVSEERKEAEKRKNRHW